MTEWIEVVTNPLGLAGFVIFLIFTYLTSRSVKTKPPWMVAVFVILAISGVAGGIGLAFYEKQAESAKQAEENARAGDTGDTINQETAGDSSPAISNTKGDVNISIQAAPPKE